MQRQFTTCAHCSVTFAHFPSENRKVCSRACQYALMASRRGPETANWKGAGTQYRQNYLKDACEDCGASDRKLHVHHLDHNRRNDDPVNLRTLCQPCHYAQHPVSPETITKRTVSFVKTMESKPGGLAGHMRWLASHNKPWTHCKHGHPIEPGNIYLCDGRKRCRICMLAAQRRSKAKRRVA